MVTKNEISKEAARLRESTLNLFKEKNYIDADVILNDLVRRIDFNSIIDILEGSYNLEYNEEEDILSYIDENSDVIICPDLSEGISPAADWLSDKLPESKFDFEQGGNLRKQGEVGALYKLVCLGVALPFLQSEIKSNLSFYDFDSMRMNKNNEYDFKLAKDIVSYYTEFNSLRINSVISAANIRISRMVEKKDTHWKSKLTRAETSEYARLSREIKSEILRYEKEHKLNPEEIKTLDKKDRIATIDERDTKIKNHIKNSNITKLFGIIKLSSESLNSSIKQEIRSKCRAFANAMVAKEGVTGDDAADSYEEWFNKLSKDLTRYSTATMRAKEIEKYRKDPIGYKVKSKA